MKIGETPENQPIDDLVLRRSLPIMHGNIWQASAQLRWSKTGKLQQRWMNMSTGETEWRDIPIEE